MLRRLLPVVVALAAPAAAPPAAGAAWTAPVTLAAGGDLTAPDVAVDARGRAAVAWADGASVRVATADRGRPLRRTLSVRSRHGAPGRPEVAFGPVGITAVWYTTVDEETERLETAVLAPRIVPRARALTPPTERLSDLFVDTAPGGDVFAGWYEAGTIRAATGPRDGVLGEPFAISDARAFQEAFAVGPRGEAVAVWNTSGGTVFASSRPPRGPFERPQRVSAPGGYAREPAVAIAPDGELVAAWSQSGAGGYRIRAATRGEGEPRFGAPQTLDAGTSPAVAVSARGAAAIVFDGGRAIRAATRAGSGVAFARSRAIGGSGGTTERPLAGADSAGGFVAAWTSRGSVFAAEGPRGRFASARRISAAENGVEQPALAVNERGDAIVAWWGDGYRRIRAVRRTPAR